MAGPALLFIAPTVGGGILASKKAENRRKQAAANAFSQKYPLVDDIGANSAALQTAKAELKAINASPARTAGAKRVKNRNSAELSKWIAVMESHGKDLKAGMAVATTQSAVASMAPNVANTPPVVMPPSQGGTQEPETPAEAAAAENMAAPTKGGTNWLLIGGIAIGAIVLYNIVKR
jgi:hypothetical protein